MSSTKNSSHVVRAVRAKTDQNRRGTKYSDLRTNPPGVFISRQEASQQDMTNLEKNPFFSNLFPFSIVHCNMFALVSKSQTTKQLYCSYVGAFGRELMVFFFSFRYPPYQYEKCEENCCREVSPSNKVREPRMQSIAN